MDANQQKFEQARERFRKNMQRENQKGRRTIFLDADEIPSCSRGKTANKNAKKQKPHIKRQVRRTTSASRLHREKPTSVRHCRITTVPNQRYDPDSAAPITISDDEVTTSPPPPQQPITSPHEETRGEIHEGEGVWDKTPSPPLIGNISVEDLIIDPEILDDPLVLEFRRTYLGRSDTTVDIRIPTPPSPFPPSSPSSIDWENENYRPPTPPRPKRYASFDIEDRQFPYLGLHCYERVWRARILVPRKHPPYALPEPTPDLTEQQIIDDYPELSESNQGQDEEQFLGVPPTPGRGWLSQSPSPIPSPPPFVRSPSPVPSPPPFVRSPSPVPSPPPFIRSPSPVPSPPPFVHSPSPIPSPPQFVISPPPTVPYQRLATPPQISPPKNPQLKDLPAEIQQTLGELQSENEGKRLRIIQEIWGQRYRVTFKANGEIIIALA